MNLSPLTIDRIRHCEPGVRAPNTGIDCSQYRRWACPNCNRTYHDECYAERCCPRAPIECFVDPSTKRRFETEAELASALAGNRGGPVFCPVCGNGGADYHDAANCCLWKDLSSAERLEVANAVELGSEWAEALGISA